MFVKTYEIQNGYIFVYYDAHLTHILRDSVAMRGDLIAKGYQQHNKWERNSTKPISPKFA